MKRQLILRNYLSFHKNSTDGSLLKLTYKLQIYTKIYEESINLNSSLAINHLTDYRRTINRERVKN